MADKIVNTEDTAAETVAAGDVPENGERAAEDGEPIDVVVELQQELGETREKLLRLRAEFDNYRKRIHRDLVDARHQARVGTLEEILPVFDHFQMAAMALEQNANLETLRQGMEMIGREFETRLQNLGVERIEAVGQPFDPHSHEAFKAEPSDSVPNNHVVSEFKAGYRLGDKLLRAASVIVSSGPASADNDSDTEG